MPPRTPPTKVSESTSGKQVFVPEFTVPDGAISGRTVSLIPTSAQIVAAGGEVVTNKSTDGTFAANSDTLYPSQKATKTYADGLVVGLLDDRGNYDASVNTFPASGGSGAAGAIKKGDIWRISVAGTLGGEPVQIGDSVRALVDTPGQTAANWGTLQTNETLATIGALIASASTATPNNTDIVATVETSTLKKITWTNIKAFLKTYFDTLYAAVGSGITNSAGVNTVPVTFDSSGNLGTGEAGVLLDAPNGTLTLQADGDIIFSSGNVLSFPASSFSSTVVMSSLPTSDPANAGQLWNSLGVVRVSAG